MSSVAEMIETIEERMDAVSEKPEDSVNSEHLRMVEALFFAASEPLDVKALGASLPEGAGNWLLALRDSALSSALAAMHQAPDRDWTVPELAEIAHLSRSAFAERFTQIMGQPPLTYLTEHRMRLAAWKLTQTRLSLAQIAAQVGYASEAAFSQAFKRAQGQSPSAFRKN